MGTERVMVALYSPIRYTSGYFSITLTEQAQSLLTFDRFYRLEMNLTVNQILFIEMADRLSQVEP